MFFKSSLDKTINLREWSPLHTGFSDWPYSSFLSPIPLTAEIPQECTGGMIPQWVWMRTRYGLAGLLFLYFYHALKVSGLKRGSAESTGATDSQDKIFSQGNAQEDFKTAILTLSYCKLTLASRQRVMNGLKWRDKCAYGFILPGSRGPSVVLADGNNS